MRTPGEIATRRPTTALSAVVLFCLSLFAGSASAATAPGALTGPTTTLTASSAALTATVNPNGTTTTAYFELGTTSAYGTTSPSATVGNGTANVAFDYTFANLKPATTYHYRVVAASSAGTTDGTDGIFTTTGSTAALAPVATTNPPTAVSSTSLTLDGSVNPNGQTTSWTFEYGKTTAYGSKTAVEDAGSGVAPTDVSVAIEKLTTGQTYHFRLVATSSAGTTNGADMTATPVGGPTVTTTAATSVSTSSATLNGTVDPNGQATNWYFDYGTTTAYGSKTPVTSAGAGTVSGNVSALLNGLAAGIYHFRIVATDAAGTVAGSDLTFSATPPVVQTGSAESASTSGVTLTGSVNPEGNPASWTFEYGKTTAYGMKTTAQSAGSGTAPTGVAAAVGNLAAGATYHYRLLAMSGSGTAAGGDVTFTTVAAVTIATSTVQSVYGHQATLTGAVSTGAAGVSVTVRAEQFGATSYTPVATSLSGPSGTWSLHVRPKLATAYEASAPGGTSQPVSISVRPAISLREITNGRFSTHVVASVSFAGKTVQLQEALSGGRWETIARARLSSNSSAIFAATRLPHGSSTIRIAMSVNQAGPGYLGGFSRTLNYQRP